MTYKDKDQFSSLLDKKNTKVIIIIKHEEYKFDIKCFQDTC